MHQQRELPQMQARQGSDLPPGQTAHTLSHRGCRAGQHQTSAQGRGGILLQAGSSSPVSWISKFNPEQASTRTESAPERTLGGPWRILVKTPGWQQHSPPAFCGVAKDKGIWEPNFHVEAESSAGHRGAAGGAAAICHSPCGDFQGVPGSQLQPGPLPAMWPSVE